MEPGSETKTPLTGGLKENTRTAWENFCLTFFGLCLVRGIELALMYSKSGYFTLISDNSDGNEEYIGDSAERDKAKKAYNKSSRTLFGLLCYYTVGNKQAQQVIAKHESSDGGKPDGYSAYKELESVCTGGQGQETTIGQLALLFESSFEKLDDVMEMVTDHQTIVRRLRSLPELTIEDIYKGHLLWQLRRCNHAEMYQLTDEMCSEDDVTYDQAMTKIVARYQKLNVAESPESEGAFFGSAKRSKSKRKGGTGGRKEVFKFPPRCFRCGSEEHRLSECPKEPCYDDKPDRSLGKPGEWKASLAEHSSGFDSKEYNYDDPYGW